MKRQESYDARHEKLNILTLIACIAFPLVWLAGAAAYSGGLYLFIFPAIGMPVAAGAVIAAWRFSVLRSKRASLVMTVITVIVIAASVYMACAMAAQEYEWPEKIDTQTFYALRTVYYVLIALLGLFAIVMVCLYERDAVRKSGSGAYSFHKWIGHFNAVNIVWLALGAACLAFQTAYAVCLYYGHFYFPADVFYPLAYIAAAVCLAWWLSSYAKSYIWRLLILIALDFICVDILGIIVLSLIYSPTMYNWILLACFAAWFVIACILQRRGGKIIAKRDEKMAEAEGNKASAAVETGEA
ncbi:MAG: hypothetical protein LUE27_01075 [Clostridia bacterium]|nr:hypothetical protein [Clostridia bacterium]